ncbi:CLUMA_CG014653, isoform A [Clunio marinus]|uniref:CLUMA_CG014653, isoform A n=1 Tax=Clunio marinus TaxID=568069 RepID=A0A1J1IMD8_9DIPT|nr:CLUMA_CG014653, isoform A [Clunio marinus]
MCQPYKYTDAAYKNFTKTESELKLYTMSTVDIYHGILNKNNKLVLELVLMANDMDENGSKS